ncbi:lipopolysaccharide biosynthesis protein [Segatella paludivivens]|uniref:lipopolysaccharide biosynthesis protein n=1 Tax=Segatella paludivivens TaxID=185294 RepID=UPI0003771F65|nr:lipopolysaccharide biosynthesis protein [Segatella paludivivens]
MNTNKTISGAIWSIVERFSKMGIQILCTFIIAQFLRPSEFGLVSMMSIFLAFSTILIDSGFGQALIREQLVSETDKSSLFWFNILLGIIMYAIFFVTAPYIAAFYNEPKLCILIRIAFIALIFQSLIVIQQALFFKSINFKIVSKISLLSVTLSGIIGIGISILRKDVWGLIIQNLSFAILQCIFFWIYSSWRPTFVYSWEAIKKYLHFSLNLLGSNILAAITDNLANLVVGKSYSATTLGQYTMANKIPYLTSGTISYSIHRVSYSLMSKFQDDNKKLQIYSQRVVGTAFWIIGPIMIILFLFANQFINILFPKEWITTAIYLRYFCIIGFVYCFYDINQDILLIKGRTDILFKLDIIRRSILVIIMIIGVRYNIIIFLRLLTIYYILNAFAVCYISGKLINYSIPRQLFIVISTPIYYFKKYIIKQQNENC